MECKKIGYPTKRQAKKALHDAQECRHPLETHVECRFYVCPNCGLFHLTSEPLA